MCATAGIRCGWRSEHWRTRDRVRNDAEGKKIVDTVVREIPVAVERRVEVPVEEGGGKKSARFLGGNGR